MMTFTRPELQVIKAALRSHIDNGDATRPEVAGELKQRIQAQLIADDCPITVRSPPSVSQGR